MFDISKYQSKNFQTLYGWHKNYGNIQKRYFKEEYKIRREKQIEDFIFLNEFKKVKIIKDNYIFNKLKNIEVDNEKEADLIVITDQTFSRYPCFEIINQIKNKLNNSNKIYLCLNRYYINIDNSFQDETLSENYNLAITQWLKKKLLDCKILDLSLDYEDDGSWFTWVIPDRHYFIEKQK